MVIYNPPARLPRPDGGSASSEGSQPQGVFMKRQRKIIVYIATSADGYIARPDGGVDWLNRPRTTGDYGMGTFLRSIDTVLWGRKTYDQAMGSGHGGGGFGR